MGYCRMRHSAGWRKRAQTRLEQSARRLRGGQTPRIPAEGVVCGDVILLSAGSLIPADGILPEAKDLSVNQTGWMPVTQLAVTSPVEPRKGHGQVGQCNWVGYALL